MHLKRKVLEYNVIDISHIYIYKRGRDKVAVVVFVIFFRNVSRYYLSVTVEFACKGIYLKKTVLAEVNILSEYYLFAFEICVVGIGNVEKNN